jgi:hypothetical protein
MAISVPGIGQNIAQAAKFQLHFDRLPEMTFFCTQVNMPGVSATEITHYTPFSDLPVPGDKIMYDPLIVQFIIDSDYKTWQSVHDWIRAYTFPKDYSEYKNLPLREKYQLSGDMAGKPQFNRPQYSDAAVTIYTNKNNPNMRIRFKDCFPITLSGVNFNAEQGAEIPITADATFRFSYYDIDRV